MTRATAILLLSRHDKLAYQAERAAQARFDVVAVAHHARHDKDLDPSVGAVASADFLFNVLSPAYVPQQILSRVRRAAINFHPAPPEWPGVGAASYALYAGQTEFGVTAHLMTERYDAGTIIAVDRFPIEPDDTCETLFDRALEQAVSLFVSLADRIVAGQGLSPSGDRWARAAVTRKEFERWMTVSPADSPDEIRRKERALRHSRYPGPFVELAGLRFELPPRRSAPDSSSRKGFAV